MERRGFVRFFKIIFLLMILPVVIIFILLSLVCYGIWIVGLGYGWYLAPIELRIIALGGAFLLIVYLLIEKSQYRSVLRNEWVPISLNSRLNRISDQLPLGFFLPFFFVWRDIMDYKRVEDEDLQSFKIRDNKTGQPASFVQLLVRNLSEVILCFVTLGISSILTFFLLFFTKDHRRVGDRIARTILVTSRNSQPSDSKIDHIESIILFSINIIMLGAQFFFAPLLFVMGVILMGFLVYITQGWILFLLVFLFIYFGYKKFLD